MPPAGTDKVMAGLSHARSLPMLECYQNQNALELTSDLSELQRQRHALFAPR